MYIEVNAHNFSKQDREYVYSFVPSDILEERWFFPLKYGQVSAFNVLTEFLLWFGLNNELCSLNYLVKDIIEYDGSGKNSHAISLDCDEMKYRLSEIINDAMNKLREKSLVLFLYINSALIELLIANDIVAKLNPIFAAKKAV